MANTLRLVSIAFVAILCYEHYFPSSPPLADNLEVLNMHAKINARDIDIQKLKRELTEAHEQTEKARAEAEHFKTLVEKHLS